MKKLILPIVLAAATLALATSNKTLSGKWHVHNSIAGNDTDQSCTFTQSGDLLSGSCSTDNGEVNISGRVDGTKVTWTYDAQYQGSPLTLNYQGTVGASGSITGDVSVPAYSVDGDFTATRSK